MDYLSVLFNKDIPFKPTPISGGTTNGLINRPIKKNIGARLPSSEKEMLEEDIVITRQKMKEQLKTTVKASGSEEHEEDEVYTKYNFEQRSPDACNLPIHGSKLKILTKLENSPTLVIEGSTGCGKSTQVRTCQFN